MNTKRLIIILVLIVPAILAMDGIAQPYGAPAAKQRVIVLQCDAGYLIYETPCPK